MNLARTLSTLVSGALLTTGLGSAQAATGIPAKIQAENFASMYGVSTETTSDTDGGLDVGWIDTGDWMAYAITVPSAGSYTIQMRVASPNATGVATLDYNAGATQLGSISIPNTGGWQAWTTVSKTVTLPAGTINLGVFAKVGGFNLNWINIVSATTAIKVEAENYSMMSGVATETTSDAGGGSDVGWIDSGDWMAYPVTLPAAGTYTVSYRVASPNSTGVISADYAAGATQLGTVTVPNTGGWQNWTTVTQTVKLPAGKISFGINAKVGGFNLNYFTISNASDPDIPVTPSDLIALKSGAQMTCQFVNNTGGKYSNSQIYALLIARNSNGKFCYLDKNGNMNPCVPGQDASAYSIKLSDFSGFQFPTFLDSGRMYVSYGKPLSIQINSDVNGNVGVAFPNIENPSDPNINTYFDWIEFAVLNNQIWCNTTQVDQFGFPLTLELFQGSSSSYKSFAKVGITESFNSIVSAFKSSVPAAFQGLAGTYRILAPLHGSFGEGKANAGYFDGYINQIWSQYSSSNLVITIPQGTFTGRVQSDSRLRFTRPNDSTPYYVSKPSTQAVWGGLAQLASPSNENRANPNAISIELALEAQICAAFHRHVMENASNFNNVSAYYQAGPCDYFSKFFHAHSIGARAYGFCYDDVNDQSSTMTCSSPRGLILSLGF